MGGLGHYASRYQYCGEMSLVVNRFQIWEADAANMTDFCFG